MQDYKRFILMSGSGRIEMLWKYGIILAERNADHHHQQLFQLEDCYVEVWFSKGSKDIYFHLFTSQAELEPWLSEIDISNLFRK